MYNAYKPYPSPYYVNNPMYNPYNMYNAYRTYPCPYYPPMSPLDFSEQFTPFTDKMEYDSRLDFSHSVNNDGLIELMDYGPEPFVVNIEEATKQNTTYRTALWTGKYLQLTLMSISVGDDIGLEIHNHHDQFIRIEEGEGLVKWVIER